MGNIAKLKDRTAFNKPLGSICGGARYMRLEDA